MLRVARRRFPGTALVRANEQLPFRAGAFDAVVALGFMEYLADPESALSEMRRVVRPKGAVLVSVPKSVHIDTVSLSLTAPVRGAAAVIWGRRSDRVRRTRFMPAVLDRLAVQAGLTPNGGAHYHFTPLPYPFTVLAPTWALRAGRLMEAWSRRNMASFLLTAISAAIWRDRGLG